eukprot:TRINITY_DN15943_c0_g1_i1.p1 TRINITY_DN15943_c0_g1~~TRINITY_DN15943_c0_g1_i1.p1  ORF type:complete len:290 (+),score=22.81 TRINITY_DN15943_c0_g1_i1:80-949(+)
MLVCPSNVRFSSHEPCKQRHGSVFRRQLAVRPASTTRVTITAPRIAVILSGSSAPPKPVMAAVSPQFLAPSDQRGVALVDSPTYTNCGMPLPAPNRRATSQLMLPSAVRSSGVRSAATPVRQVSAYPPQGAMVFTPPGRRQWGGICPSSRAIAPRRATAPPRYISPLPCRVQRFPVVNPTPPGEVTVNGNQTASVLSQRITDLLCRRAALKLVVGECFRTIVGPNVSMSEGVASLDFNGLSRFLRLILWRMGLPEVAFDGISDDYVRFDFNGDNSLQDHFRFYTDPCSL